MNQIESEANVPARNTHLPRRANLIGIGAPRTATTSLARMLEATGRVFVPPEKEVNGFGINVDVTEALYDSRFAEAGPGCRYLADISPVYLSNIRSAERIRTYNPEAKIIATLREPLGRVVSQYRHMKAKIDTSLGPELKLDLNAYLKNGIRDLKKGRYEESSWYSAAMNIAHSLYGRNLHRYYDLFPRDQILVLIYEDLIGPRSLLARGKWAQQLRDFLGFRVRQRFWENRADGFETEIAPEIAGELRELFAAEVTATSHLIDRDLNRLWGYPVVPAGALNPRRTV